jgi:quinol monooxygenase YgiN
MSSFDTDGDAYEDPFLGIPIWPAKLQRQHFDRKFNDAKSNFQSAPGRRATKSSYRSMEEEQHSAISGKMLSIREDHLAMLTVTAVVRAKNGQERALRDAFTELVRNVHANEPGTIDFFLTQNTTDPSTFTTYERFTDQVAMDHHNRSDILAHFFNTVKPILDGDVKLSTGTEIEAKDSL